VREDRSAFLGARPPSFLPVSKEPECVWERREILSSHREILSPYRDVLSLDRAVVSSNRDVLSLDRAVVSSNRDVFSSLLESLAFHEETW
jgi:hypothetical protein